jgi:sigma-B regulation protein RsbU (phosphoserine phosphatase)
VVDDEPKISEMFKTLFELEGFTCFTANDADTAMDQTLNIKPDLILSDITMPNVDGFEFRRRVLSSNEISKIPFVFLTSNNNDSFILNGYDLAAEDYILKSTNPTIILKKINAIFTSIAKVKDTTVGELSNAAKEIGSELIPEESPSFEGCLISKVHIPYQGIPGGDFVDFIKLNEDSMAVVVGDIMGKKWDAWFINFAFISYIRSSIRYELENSDSFNPAAILQSVNKSIIADTRLSNFFINVSLVIIDKKMNAIHYSGAGDLPLIQKSKTSDVTFHFSEGINLGIKENGFYNSTKINLETGDTFYIYTDGIIEVSGQSKELLGTNGLKTIIEKKSSVKDIVESVRLFSDDQFDDDLTLVSIKNLE